MNLFTTAQEGKDVRGAFALRDWRGKAAASPVDLRGCPLDRPDFVRMAGSRHSAATAITGSGDHHVPYRVSIALGKPIACDIATTTASSAKDSIALVRQIERANAPLPEEWCRKSSLGQTACHCSSSEVTTSGA